MAKKNPVKNPVKKSEKKCDKCGVIVKSYSYGFYCQSCAAEVWDAGFESTTQHAEEIHEQMVKEIEEINNMLNKANISYEEIRKLVKYRSGVFRCAVCGKFQLRWVHSGEKKNEEKLKKVLMTPCPKCNSIGNLKFE